MTVAISGINHVETNTIIQAIRCYISCLCCLFAMKWQALANFAFSTHILSHNIHIIINLVSSLDVYVGLIGHALKVIAHGDLIHRISKQMHRFGIKIWQYLDLDTYDKY